jgi:serine/threonine protein phosphatase PrpC
MKDNMKLTNLSLKGSSPMNEDAYVCNESNHIYGVIDGATSLVPFASSDGETGGVLAAKVIAQYLNNKELPHINQPQELMHLLSKANELLRKSMEQNHVEMENKEELWSACAVLVHIDDHWIDYAHAGDCMLIVYYQDQTIRVVTHDQLGHIDQLTLDRWAEGAAAGLVDRDALWEYTKPQIILGRKLANAPGGYAVLNGDPAFSSYAEYGRISRVGIKALLLVSDGLYIPKASGAPKIDGAAELALFVRDMGLQQYIDWLIGLEESDPECIQYPRVKKSDDKTALYIDLGED